MKHPTIQSLAVLCLTAACTIAAAADEPGIRIDTHRLDLTKRDTVALLYARIQSSARKVCRDALSSSETGTLRKYERCYHATVENAVSSVHVPLLTAQHEEATRVTSVAQAGK